MLKGTIRKGIALGLSSAMLLSSFAGTVFAAAADNQSFTEAQVIQKAAEGTGVASNATYITNNAGSAYSGITNKGDVAQITLGKNLSASQENKFPKVNEFIYSIEKVVGWQVESNNTVSEAQGQAGTTLPDQNNGTEIPKSQMPNFISDLGTSYHYVHNIAPTGGENVTYVSIGDFTVKETAKRNEGTVYELPADTSTEKVRSTKAAVQFSKAGYYVYKIKEVGSTPNTSTTPNVQQNYSSAKKDVKGVDYDDNEYFVIFYVAHKTATAADVAEDPTLSIGDTLNDVYVHSITSWTNSANTEWSSNGANKPTLTDIQNITDNGGRKFGPNEGSVNADGTVTHNTTDAGNENSGKVGGSANTPDPEDPTKPLPTAYSDAPNKLNAFRMWNRQVTHDVVITENVKGNLGDKSELFGYKVTITNLEAGQTYTAGVTGGIDATDGQKSTVNIKAMAKDPTDPDKTIGNPTRSNDNITGFTSTDEGNGTGKATFYVYMKDGDSIVINSLPLGAEYTVEHLSSDHVTSYDITSSNKSDETKAVLENGNATSEGSNAKVSDANTQSGKALEAKKQVVSRYDNTVTEAFVDTRTMATPTGIAVSLAALAIAGLAIGLGVLLIRRRNDSVVEDIEL